MKEGGQSSEKTSRDNREDSESSWAVKLHIQKYRVWVCSLTTRSCRWNEYQFSSFCRADGLRAGGSTVWINLEQTGVLPEGWVVSASWGCWFWESSCDEIMVVKPYSDNTSGLALPFCKIYKFIFVWNILVQWLIGVSFPVQYLMQPVRIISEGTYIPYNISSLHMKEKID